jgi:tetratricopeptide (TPR) repeat protein
MPDVIRCPDCGHENPPGSAACEACNFPLGDHPQEAPPAPPARPAAGAAADAEAPTTPAAPPLRLRPIRPRRPRPQSNVALQLWLGVGAFLALLLVFIAFQANMERDKPQVEGSNQDQQKQADLFRAALAKDSTDVEARIGLADILFDTGNWSEAIVHYRSAIHRDSTRVGAIVDLGVCYYNLSQPDDAERLFQLGLARDPHHPFALFNLGIIQERRGDLAQALQYFHRALESAPPENMKPSILEAMQRVQKQTGKAAPPLSTP